MKLRGALVSKTMLFNAVTLVVVVLGYYGFDADAAIAEEVEPFIPIIVLIINMWLRWITNKGLEEKEGFLS